MGQRKTDWHYAAWNARCTSDYVFDELSKEEGSNYKELIKGLKRCFHKVESTKIYAAIFWKHDQKASESGETYVIELKRVYGKAYPQCDSTSWDEDLLP